MILIHTVLIHPNDENITTKILESFENGSKKELFKVYHFLFQKEYNLASEEGMKRYKIFKQTVKFIEETNSQSLSYKLGINQFSDLTNDEFRNQILSRNLPQEDEHKRTEDLGDTEKYTFLPQQSNLNWLSKMNPVSNQGVCGSCWAFASVGALESNYNIQFNILKQFSQQYLVDCDTSNSGCNGGSPLLAYYTIRKVGIPDLALYPYTGVKGSCLGGFTNDFMINAVDSCSNGTCTKTSILGLLASGPFPSAMDASSKVFQSYKSGILDGLSCSSTNHAVIIAGYYKDATSEYYTVRNSWSTTWGEQGNFRIKPNTTGTCFLETQAYLPKLSAIVNTPPKSCLKLFPSCSFVGTSYDLCDSMATFPNFNGTVSSIANIFGEGVYLFSGASCTGNSFSINSDFSCLSSTTSTSGLVNNIKSIAFANRDATTAGCIKVYDTACSASTVKIEICASNPDLSTINWGMKISSFRMNKSGFKSVTLYTGKNYTGNALTASGNGFALPAAYNKKIMSVKFNP
jgi:C1A family cysteine protease